MVRREAVKMKLDHLVYFTAKTPKEIVKEQLQMGWHAVVGGKHEQWGTQNALMYVKNAYIEWLSIENEERVIQSKHPLIEQMRYDLTSGEKWGTVCFSVKNIEQTKRQLEENGFSTLNIMTASRVMTSGEEIHWKMLFLEQDSLESLPYPFFIEWEVEEVERYKKLRELNSYGEENEELFVTECLFNVYEPKKTARLWATLLQTVLATETEIKLNGVNLRFREKQSTNGLERLIDVTIEYT